MINCNGVGFSKHEAHGCNGSLNKKPHSFLSKQLKLKKAYQKNIWESNLFGQFADILPVYIIFVCLYVGYTL